MQEGTQAQESITFTLIDAKVAGGEFLSPTDPAVSISIDNPYLYLELLQDADSLVIDKHRITVEVAYPLDKPSMFPLYSPTNNGFTRKDLIIEVSKLYHWIYDVEEKTSNIEVAKHSRYKWNRCHTNGCFGLWGHFLYDLDLVAVTYDKDRHVYTLVVDS